MNDRIDLFAGADISIHNSEAEAAVLGAVFTTQDIEKQQAILDELQLLGLTQEDFFHDTNKKIYNVICKLFISKTVIDILTVNNELLELNELSEEVCEQIALVSNATPTAANVAYYVQLVKQASRKRNVFSNLRAVIADIHENGVDMERIQKLIEKDITETPETIRKIAEKYSEQSASSKIENFLDKIVADSENLQAYPTGLHNLDAVLGDGMREGLYFIAGGTSVGKTAIPQQIADNVAEAGRDVIYISLEMSERELMARSLSRLTYRLACNQKKNILKALTSRAILSNSWGDNVSEELLVQACEWYEKFASHIYYFEGVGDVTVEKIRNIVNRHIKITGNKPLLVIDYLQLIACADVRATDKVNTDKNVMELKRISRDYKIPVLAISSVSRSQYREKINIASSKESGSIEYSADVIIGLQLKGQGEPNFNEMEARSKNVRDLELHILKNRQGRVGVKINYEYITPYNAYNEKNGVESMFKTEKDNSK